MPCYNSKGYHLHRRKQGKVLSESKRFEHILQCLLISFKIQCNSCGFFEWVRQTEIFSISSPPNSAALAQPLDPALPHAPSQLPSLLGYASPSASVATQSNGRSKAICKHSPCGHIAAASCTKGMCKACCLKTPAICFFKNHNGGQRPVSQSQNPGHLPRPLPSVPLLLPSQPAFNASISSLGPPSIVLDPVLLRPASPINSQASMDHRTAGSASPTVVPNEFLFKKPVPRELAEDYQKRRVERDIRLALEASRAENQRSINHAVILVVYLMDDLEPLFLPLQDIKTWPTLNLSQIPTLADLLGLPNLASLELFASRLGFWVPSLNFAMAVKTDEKVYIRKKGLSSGPSNFAVMTPRALDLPSTPKKRKAGTPQLELASYKMPRLDLTLNSSPPSSPSPGHVQEVFQIADETPMDPLDIVWDSGYVTTPPESYLKWPQGMYVRDMAKGFALLSNAVEGGVDGTLEVRFPMVFPGKPWKHSTYHANRKFWFGLPADVRQKASNLPRNPAGLWTEWRKTQK